MKTKKKYTAPAITIVCTQLSQPLLGASMFDLEDGICVYGLEELDDVEFD